MIHACRGTILRVVGLLGVALSGPAVRGAELPMNRSVFLVSEATTGANLRLLNASATPTATAPAPARLQTADFSKSGSLWRLQPVGQPGRVAILHQNSRALLEAETAPADDQPAVVKLVIPAEGVAVTAAQQWRVMETETGALLFQNVQTGRLLDANPDELESANGLSTVRCLGREGKTANRQWRIVRNRIAFTDETNGTTATPLPLTAPGGERFAPKTATNKEKFAGAVTMTVTVELVGHGTDKLEAKVTLTATDGKTTITGSNTYLLRQAPAGRKIYLGAGVPTTETLMYSDSDATEKMVDSAGKVVTAAPAVRTPPGLINHCKGVSRGAATDPADAGKTGVIVVLEPIAFMMNLP